MGLKRAILGVAVLGALLATLPSTLAAPLPHEALDVRSASEPSLSEASVSEASVSEASVSEASVSELTEAHYDYSSEDRRSVEESNSRKASAVLRTTQATTKTPTT